MPKKGHTEQQIVAVLRQAEAGEKVADICRKVGIARRLLRVEKAIRWFGYERVARIAAVAGREWTVEATGRGLESG
jgi:hypothetical protein